MTFRYSAYDGRTRIVSGGYTAAGIAEVVANLSGYTVTVTDTAGGTEIFNERSN